MNDTADGLAAGESISYKWSTSADCGTSGYSEAALSPATVGSTSASVTVTTE